MIPTKEKIMTSFFNLLAQEPFKDINVQKIMAHAHLSRTLFYQYFDSKEDLARVALEEQVSQLIEHLVPAKDSLNTYRADVLAGMQSILGPQSRLDILLKVQRPSFNLTHEFQAEIKQTVLRQVRRQQPHVVNCDADYYAEIFTVSMLSTLQWYLEQTDFPLEKLADYVTTCMFKGHYTLLTP